MTTAMDYEVKLEIFQGPLDLLLHLIRKNEVDIFDIPIATITNQYLEYLDMMKALNINLAGDFLVMASTLIHIKSKMLLPSVDEEEEGDPRVEIVRPLIEYMRLKELAVELAERETLGRDIFARSLFGEYEIQMEAGQPVLDVSLFQLIDAFRNIVDQRLPGASLRYQVEKWSLKDKTTFIMERLKDQGPLYFRDLFSEDRTISEFIVTFLALLELINVGLVRVFQPDPSKEIRLEANFEEVPE